MGNSTSGGFHWAPRHGPGIIRREGDEVYIGDEDFITGGSFDGISSTERIITSGGRHWSEEH